MDYQIDFGIWGSIFPVPCAVADRHLKLCSGIQLKVLLLALREGKSPVDLDAIALRLGLSREEAEDCLRYWEEAGLFSAREGAPAAEAAPRPVSPAPARPAAPPASPVPPGPDLREERTTAEGQKITLTVSLGTQYVTIPETKNMVAEDAEQTLKDMGLRVLQKPMQDNTVANGAVIYTSPSAGETVEGDSTVIMYVSRAVIESTNDVPSLTGKLLEDARNDVKGLNFSIRVIEQASTEPAGTVLSQLPAAGTKARVSSIITLVVSTGVPETPAETPTPSEDGTVQESWWWSADGSHQIHQLPDGTMWNENGERCDAQGNPI